MGVTRPLGWRSVKETLGGWSPAHGRAQAEAPR